MCERFHLLFFSDWIVQYSQVSSCLQFWHTLTEAIEGPQHCSSVSNEVMLHFHLYPIHFHFSFSLIYEIIISGIFSNMQAIPKLGTGCLCSPPTHWHTRRLVVSQIWHLSDSGSFFSPFCSGRCSHSPTQTTQVSHQRNQGQPLLVFAKR